MTAARTFAQGDQVTHQDGDTFVVVTRSKPNSPVHVATLPGVDPYYETWLPAEALK